MYEKADCQQLFHVHVTINQVCGFSTSQQVFLEVRNCTIQSHGEKIYAVLVNRIFLIQPTILCCCFNRKSYWKNYNFVGAAKKKLCRFSINNSVCNK